MNDAMVWRYISLRSVDPTAFELFVRPLGKLDVFDCWTYIGSYGTAENDEECLNFIASAEFSREIDLGVKVATFTFDVLDIDDDTGELRSARLKGVRFVRAVQS